MLTKIALMCKILDNIHVAICKGIFMKLAIYRRDEQNESSKAIAERSPKIILYKRKSKNYLKTCIVTKYISLCHCCISFHGFYKIIFVEFLGCVI